MATILVSIACGIVGTFVVIKRIVFISGGISHAAFGGIGLGYLLGLNPILVAIPFSILFALGMGVVSKKLKINEDTAIGVLWALGVALGIIFIAFSPGYAPDLFSYLFGSILTVSFSDLILMLFLDLIIILIVSLFFKELQAISFDEEFSVVVGIPARALYFLLLGLVALSVVILIKVVGVILVIALLTIPAVLSRQFTSNLKKLMIYAVLAGIIFTVAGLSLSYFFDLPSGATIVLVLSVVFFLSLIYRRIS